MNVLKMNLKNSLQILKIVLLRLNYQGTRIQGDAEGMLMLHLMEMKTSRKHLSIMV
jgi:hypothetical protein